MTVLIGKMILTIHLKTVVKNKRRRTSTKRQIDYDDVTENEDDAPKCNLVDGKTKRRYRKTRKSNRGRKPSTIKKESADIKNLELLNENELDDGEDFMENFNKSIKVCFPPDRVFHCSRAFLSLSTRVFKDYLANSIKSNTSLLCLKSNIIKVC